MSDLEMKVVLPPSLKHFFKESGYTEPTYFEGRRNARLRIRAEATMKIESSPPSIHRDSFQSIVWVKDISRRGFSVLSHTQLWPEETVYFCFQDRHVKGTIIRCLRHGEFCWECGGTITTFHNAEESNQE